MIHRGTYHPGPPTEDLPRSEQLKGWRWHDNHPTEVWLGTILPLPRVRRAVIYPTDHPFAAATPCMHARIGLIAAWRISRSLGDTGYVPVLVD